MSKTLIEEKLAIFEPFMGKDVKIKVTIIEQGIYGKPLQIIVLAGRLIGVEADVSKAMINVVLDSMLKGMGNGAGEPLPLNFSDSPQPKIEIEELYEEVFELDDDE